METRKMIFATTCLCNLRAGILGKAALLNRVITIPVPQRFYFKCSFLFIWRYDFFLTSIGLLRSIFSLAGSTFFRQSLSNLREEKTGRKRVGPLCFRFFHFVALITL